MTKLTLGTPNAVVDWAKRKPIAPTNVLTVSSAYSEKHKVIYTFVYSNTNKKGIFRAISVITGEVNTTNAYRTKIVVDSPNFMVMGNEMVHLVHQNNTGESMVEILINTFDITQNNFRNITVLPRNQSFGSMVYETKEDRFVLAGILNLMDGVTQNTSTRLYKINPNSLACDYFFDSFGVVGMDQIQSQLQNDADYFNKTVSYNFV